ncbi:SxtJ family membrane protein [Leptospira sp. 'Mane']|uniref:SxtJ family membrane protein n=1 Tax=Leptospira sp. 'Mane' TaxID=3387407 RepID=UPI00398AD108
MSSQKIEPTSSDLRKFSYIVGGVLALIFGLAIPYLNRGSWNPYLVGTGTALIFLGTVIPKILYWPFRAWMLVGEVLGWINTRIILSVIFFLLFTPIGLLKRLFGNDSLKRKLDADATTYRVIPPVRTTDHMERPF